MINGMNKWDGDPSLCRVCVQTTPTEAIDTTTAAGRMMMQMLGAASTTHLCAFAGVLDFRAIGRPNR